MLRKSQVLQIFRKISILELIFLCVQAAEGSHANDTFRLKVDLSISGLNQEIKSWTLSDLLKFKKTTSKEKDPQSGKIQKWDGVLLSHLIEKGMEELQPERKAQVDLVVLRSSSGDRALLPRAFVSKYPILLAFQSNVQSIDQRGQLFSIVPWSSKPRILDEGLPLESYFLPQIDRIQFTSYRDQYSPLFLKKRTDPSAMRGEKLFVQNCATCHIDEKNPSAFTMMSEKTGVLRNVAGAHPPTKVSLKFKEKDWKSIVRYLDAHRAETSLSVSRLAGSPPASNP